MQILHRRLIGIKDSHLDNWVTGNHTCLDYLHRPVDTKESILSTPLGVAAIKVTWEGWPIVYQATSVIHYILSYLSSSISQRRVIHIVLAHSCSQRRKWLCWTCYLKSKWLCKWEEAQGAVRELLTEQRWCQKALRSCRRPSRF